MASLKNIIALTVKGRTIAAATEYAAPVEGNVAVDFVRFSFEGADEFSGLVKRVGFASRAANIEVDYSDELEIPWEVLARHGALRVSVVGYNAEGREVLHTAKMECPILIAKSGWDEGAEPTPATLDVVSRIDALAADLEEKRDTDYWRGPAGPKGDPGEQGAPGKDGSDASATDVRIAGESITTNGTADIPKAGAGELGVVRVDRYGKNGIALDATGEAKVNPASDALISSRSGVRPVTASNIDYAVRSAMCDGKGAAWTAAEQTAARERMGIDAAIDAKLGVIENASY